ncbi:MAG: septum formation initiator family protein [Acidimicrobiales bacterium]
MTATHNYATRERNHWMVPLALVTALVMLVGWFPLSALWHQQSVIDQTAAQISAIKKQELSLETQAKSVSSKEAATLLAREQYQLVSPGQSLIQVLPGDGSGHVSSSAGDPGLQPLVAPSSVSSLAANAAASAKAARHSTNGFLARFVRTLEFWR